MVSQDQEEEKDVLMGGLDVDHSTRIITLESKNGQMLKADAQVLKQSKLFKVALEEDKETERIHVPTIEFDTLSVMVDFMNVHHENPMKTIQKPVLSSDPTCFASDQDVQILRRLNQQQVFELILAANYADIPALLELTCAYVASMMKGKTAEQIRRMFNIVNDFTPEEEEEIIKQNQWAQDL